MPEREHPSESNEAREEATDGDLELTDSLARRLQKTLEAAREHGFFEKKTETISARVNPALLELARQRTGITSNTELVEVAIANLVVEDTFPGTFTKLRGSVPSEVDLEI